MKKLKVKSYNLFYLLLLITLPCLNVFSQEQLTDFVYRTVETKSLNNEIFGGNNETFWIKTESKLTNFDEISAFNPKIGEIIY